MPRTGAVALWPAICTIVRNLFPGHGAKPWSLAASCKTNSQRRDSSTKFIKMKRILLFLFVSFSAGIVSAQEGQTSNVKFSIKNSSLLPKKVTIISYAPGESKNGTEQITMWPKSVKALSFKEGTRVYLASSKQVDLVMSGKRIDQDKPFLVVKKENEGKTFVY